MPANIDTQEILEQKKNQESNNVEYSRISHSGQSEREITWIKLHQMFDR